MSYPYRDAVLALDPVGYWPLDDGTAVVGADLTPQNSPGSAPAHVVGGPGSSSFSRPDFSQYEGVHQANMEFIGGVPFTIVVWARPGSNGDSTDWNIACQRSDAGDLPGWQVLQGYLLGQASCVFDQGAAGDDEKPVNGVFQNNVVQFVAWAFDGTTLDVYKNGLYMGSGVPARTIADSAGGIFRVSANQSGVNGFTGELSELAVFATELSAAEIRGLYQAGAGELVVRGDRGGSRIYRR